jgi:hypothetical protein
MQPIYLVCGVPGSGKTWVCERVLDHYHWVPQDQYITKDRAISPIELHKKALIQAARTEVKPIIGEVPFMISIMIGELRGLGHDVRPVFVIEPPWLVKRRYEAREKKTIPQMHLTRVATVRQRANALSLFSGKSEDVLAYLRAIVTERTAK